MSNANTTNETKGETPMGELNGTTETVTSEKEIKPMFKNADRFILDDNGVIVDITEKEVDRLSGLIIDIFEWCECYPELDYNEVPTMVKEWFKNKLDLLNLIVKSPFYNGDYAIEFNKPIKRSFDKATYNEFLDTMYNVSNFGLKEIEPYPHFTYREISAITDRLSTQLYHLNELKSYGLKDILPVRDKVILEYDKWRDINDKIINNDEYSIANSHVYKRDEYKLHRSARDCFSYLSNKYKQSLTKEMAERLNYYIPELKAKENQKTSRAVNKICTLVGLNLMTNQDYLKYNLYKKDMAPEKNRYNYEFAKFADACNPFEVDKHVFISIHPIDFLSMSFGTNWTSCHTIDKENKHGFSSNTGATYRGCYSSGTESYMLDGTSIVFFILGNDAFDKQKELNEPTPRKEMRQMFHIGKEKFIQGRLYPYDQTDRDNYAEPEDYVQYRNIVQNLLSELWDIPNLWTNKRGIDICYSETTTHGTHYSDYTHYSNCNISYIKEYSGTEKIVIGHNPLCPKCGQAHSEAENCFCDSCRNENQGTWCEYHERYEDEEMTYIEGYGDVCDRALDEGDFHYCDHCETWYYSSDGERSDRDGLWFCCPECAENHGYVWVDSEDDWIDEDEVEYSEISNCYIPTYNDDAVCAYYNEDDDMCLAWEDDCTYYNGDWYDSELMVRAENGDYIPEWLSVEAFDDEDNREHQGIYEEEDCMEIDGDWFTKNLCVCIDGEYVPIWDTEADENGELRRIA